MQKKYQTLLVDLDNTLANDEESKKYAYKKVLEKLNKKVTEESLTNLAKKDDQFWNDRAEGKIPDEYTFFSQEEKTKWIRAKKFMLFFEELSFEEAVQCNELYIKAIAEKVVSMPSALEVIQYLYKKEYRYLYYYKWT